MSGKEVLPLTEDFSCLCVFRLLICQLWRRSSPVCGLSVSVVRVHYMKMCCVPGMYTHIQTL